ncbi:MAG: ATP-binding protein [Hymenobacter sp.]
MEADTMSLQPAAFSLETAVRDTIEIVRSAAARKQIELNLTIDSSIPLYVSADAGRVRQVLLNFVSNAIKFTDKGSVAIHVGPGRSANRILFEVVDTGVGISEKLLETIPAVHSARRFR